MIIIGRRFVWPTPLVRKGSIGKKVVTASRKLKSEEDKTLVMRVVDA